MKPNPETMTLWQVAGQISFLAFVGNLLSALVALCCGDWGNAAILAILGAAMLLICLGCCCIQYEKEKRRRRP